MAAPCKYFINGKTLSKEQFLDYVKTLSQDEIASVTPLMKKKVGEFSSIHFDEKNILVHIRHNTRTDADGNKVLFLEEIQSDWGQKGKKEGFKEAEKITKVYASEIAKNVYAIRENNLSILEKIVAKSKEDAIKKYLENPKSREGAIPTAPFVTETNAWTKLGLKVALKEAVKQGADKIAWTTGEQQNDRYDLSKQVDYIQYEDAFGGRKYIDISTPTGLVTFKVESDGKIIENKNTPMTDAVGKNLADVIGKDIAERILADKKSSGRLEGEGLKIGGKGMKGFYGSPTEGSLGIVGNVAKSLFKQEPKTVDIFQSDKLASGWSVTVKDKQGNVTTNMFDSKSKGLAWLSKQDGVEVLSEDAEGKNYSTQHSIDITPELIAEVQQGLPRFNINAKTLPTSGLLRRVNAVVSPFYSSPIKTRQDIINLRNSTPYKQFVSNISYIAEVMKLPTPKIFETIGGYEFENGTNINEVSFKIGFDTEDKRAVDLFASLMGVLGNEYQEAVISINYATPDKANGNEYTLKIKDVDKAWQTLLDLGIKNFTINETNFEINLLLFPWDDANEFIPKFEELLNKLKETDNYEGTKRTEIESRYFEQKDRRDVYKAWLGNTNLRGQNRRLFDAIKEAERRETNFTERGELKPEDNTLRFSAEDITTNKALNDLKQEYGIDLRSEVYQQQSTESDEDYRDRIFDEVWAKITAQEGNAILEDKSLWKKIKDLLVDLQQWFADKLGLKGTDLENLTPQQLGKQSLSSLIKGEYLPVPPKTKEVPKTKDGIIIAKNIQEIYDSLDPAIKEFIEKSGKKLEEIPVTSLKLLAHPRLSVTDKLLFLGDPNSLRKAGLTDAKLKELVDAQLDLVVTYEDHLNLAKSVVNKYLNKDTSVSVTSQVDAVLMSALYYYFYNNRKTDSLQIMADIAVVLKDISSTSASALSVFSPHRNLDIITGFIMIEAHGNVFRQLKTSDGGKPASEIIREFQEQIKLKDDELEKVKKEIERVMADAKKYNKKEGLKGGFRSVKIEDTVNALISKVNAVPRASIIGEIGAENLPIVRDNLQIAREMEATGKTPKEIFLATGWERTKDNGKWKYDLSDTKVSISITENTEYKLIDIYNNKALFDAYPQLSNLKVVFNSKYKKGNASFFKKQKNVELPFINLSNEDIDKRDVKETYQSMAENLKRFLQENPNGNQYNTVDYVKAKIELYESRAKNGVSEKEYQKDVTSILVHEIQHAIQDIEGFAKGGNQETAPRLKMDALQDIRSKIKELNIDPYKIQNQISMKYKISDDILDKYRKWQELKELEDDVLAEIVSPYEAYKRLAGEVEARNAQKRLTMAHGQRKEQMLSETEDIAEESKIYIYGTNTPNIRFAAEPEISEVERGLIDLMLASYQNAKGDILQAKLIYEKSLERLKDVNGENIYDKLVGKLPSGFDLTRDIINSDTYKAEQAKINQEAALDLIEKRINGDKNSKGLGFRTSFDYVDNFIKEIFNRVNPIVTLKLDTINTNAFVIPTKEGDADSKAESIAYDYRVQAEDLVKTYNEGGLSIYELEKALKDINKSMKKDLDKFTDFKDFFPEFTINYQNTPVDGSVIKLDKSTYIYKDGKWHKHGDLREIEPKRQSQITKAYESKVSTPDYVKNSNSRLQDFLANKADEDVATLFTQAYQDFKKRGYSPNTIKKIEDFIYAGFGVDVNDVAIRHMVDTDLALENKILKDIIDNSYSSGAHAEIARDLTERLGIDEYDAKVVESKIRAYIEREIAPEKAKYLNPFLKDAKIVKEALKLITDGKMSDLDLLPIFSQKFNIKLANAKLVTEFNNLSNALRNAETRIDKSKASAELLKFFVNHKKETWVKEFGMVLIEGVYGSMFGFSTLFNAATSLLPTLSDIASMEVLMAGDVITHLLKPKDGISVKEWAQMHGILAKTTVSSILTKGLPEVLHVLVTMENSSSYMSGSPLLTKDTVVKQRVITRVNTYFEDLVKLTRETLKREYKAKNAKIFHKIKNAEGVLEEVMMDIDSNEKHPLYMFRDIFAEHRNSPDFINKVLEELTRREDLLKGSYLGIGTKAKLQDIINAKVFVEGNRDSITKVELATNAELWNKGFRAAYMLVPNSVGLALGMIYRALALPLIPDILIKAFKSSTNVAFDTYADLLLKDPTTRNLVKDINRALGDSTETDEILTEEGYKKIGIKEVVGLGHVMDEKTGKMRRTNPIDWVDYNRRKQEIQSTTIDETVWSVAERGAKIYGMMNKPQGAVGALANVLSYGINSSSLVTYTADAPNNEKYVKDTIWTITKLVESIFVPFMLKVGVNTFNLGMQYNPIAYLFKLLGSAGMRKFNEVHRLVPDNWSRIKDTYKNKQWEIKPTDGGYGLFKSGKLLGTYNSEEEAILQAESTYFKIPESVIKALDPHIIQTSGYKRGSGVRIEEEYELNTREKWEMVGRAIQGAIIGTYLVSLLYDVDYDPETGLPILVRKDDSKFRLVGDGVGYSKTKLTEKGLEPRTLHYKTENGWMPIFKPAGTPLEGMLYHLYTLDDMMYASYTPNSETGDKLNKANQLGYFPTMMKMMASGFTLGLSDAIFKDIQNATSYLFSMNPFVSDTQGQGKEKTNKVTTMAVTQLRSPLVRALYGGNMVRNTAQLMGEGQYKYKAVNPALSPLSDFIWAGNILTEKDKIQTPTIQAHVVDLFTSDFMQKTRIPQFLFGLNGSLKDNFIPDVSSTGMPNKVKPNIYGSFSFLTPTRTEEQETGYDKWIKSKPDVYEGYTYLPYNTHLNGITTDEENTELRATVMKLETDLMKLFYDNNKVVAEDIEKIPSVIKGENFVKSNERMKTKTRIQFNNNIRNKAYNTAIVLAVAKLIAENPKNKEILIANISSNPKPAFNGAGILKIGSVTSNDSKFKSSDPYIKSTPNVNKTIKDTEEHVERPMNFDVNVNSLSVDLSKLGFKEGEIFNANLSRDKLKTILGGTIIFINDKRTTKRLGVAMNSKNELVPR